MKRVIHVFGFWLLMFFGFAGRAQNEVIEVPDWITDTLYRLPEVIREGHYVDSVSHHEQHFIVLAFPEKTNGVKYWHAEVCEDNGMAYVPYFHFYAWSRGRILKFYDIERGKVMSLAAWRKTKPSWHER